MKIKNFKSKCMKGSLILILTGALIAFSGFFMTGFSIKPFEETNGHRWYQTIYVENGNMTYGVKMKSFSIIKIGGSPFVFVLGISE